MVDVEPESGPEEKMKALRQQIVACKREMARLHDEYLAEVQKVGQLKRERLEAERRLRREALA